MKKKIRQIMIAILWGVGLLVAGFGMSRILDAKRCQSWTQVKGRIMDSTIAEIADMPNNKTTEISMPDIKYEYSFKGTTYFNQNIGYFGTYAVGLSDSYYAGTEEQIGKFVNQYPINSTVDVYVNPEKPAQAVLDTGMQLPVFMPFLFGVLLVYAGCHIYLFGNFYIPDFKKMGKLA